jgi:hypothetical protein
MSDLTNAYAQIIKSEKQEDGTLLVYGKATDDSVDIDQQICDSTWLDRAMPDWFKSGGNIREQHSNIAAGVAKEYEAKGDGHYISALVVDPVSVKKVETGVLKGFSIGIRAPRIIRDNKAANGRIIDGQIVEISLVDRPANPNAKLVLAKSVESEESLVKVEEMIETSVEKSEELGGAASGIPSREEMVERYAAARKALDEVSRMCKECGYDDIEKQYGESAEQETAEGPMVGADTAQHEVSEAEGKAADSVEKCLECGCHQPSDSHGATTIRDGANVATPANVSTAQIVSPADTPKSAEPEEKEDSASENEAENLPTDKVDEIVEKALKSAKESVISEVHAFKSATEAAEKRVAELETELAVAKSMAISGGPKRTAIKAGIETNDLYVKAAEFSAKASSTTDPDLAKGYRELANSFLAKAKSPADSE